MIDLLAHEPLLLLIVVIAIGYPLGRMQIFGVELGMAAVLFAGLAISSLDSRLKLPDVVYQLGLVMFVYTIGLASGQTFFQSFRKRGFEQNLLVLGVLITCAVAVWSVHRFLDVKSTMAAGLFAGSLTNTPALAAAMDTIRITAAKEQVEQALSEPIVGYSLTYPRGVVGMLLAVILFEKLRGEDPPEESSSLVDTPARLASRTIQVVHPEAARMSLGEMIREQKWDAVFGRWKHGVGIAVASDVTILALGDLVTVVATEEMLDRITAYLGRRSHEMLELDRSQLDNRLICVSDSRIVGQRLADLNLPQNFGAVITRIRRGDVEIVPRGDTKLELGDLIRVVAQTEHLDAISKLFGDSYKALSEVDYMSFSVGLALGLLVGMIPIPLPGGMTVRLGFAGGPLLVALVLGSLRRTGPMAWVLPFNANLTLRQIGLTFFLAGVGVRSGYAFASTFQNEGGLTVFLIGAAITCFAATLLLWVGHRFLALPSGILIGMLAGMQTQPAVLAFASERRQDDSPHIGYATVFPLATIAKIVLAQSLVMAM